MLSKKWIAAAVLAAFLLPAGSADAKKPKPKPKPYPTVCDKKPKLCGDDYNPLPSLPRPKPRRTNRR